MSLNSTSLSLKLRKSSSFGYEVMASYSIRHEVFQDILFEDQQISIADGLLTIGSGFQWRSFVMCAHMPLVFFGLARPGVSDKVFIYGQPWITEHSILRAALLQYRSTLAIDRASIDEIYAQGLVDAKIAFPSLWSGVARWFG